MATLTAVAPTSTEASVPIHTELGACYPDRPDAPARFEKIKTAFELAYGHPPELYARAPGRVNLIGEHIDYEGYGVLPMAIWQDTVVAIRKGGDKLVIGNVDTDKYPTVEFDLDPKQEVDVHNHSWGNYFLSAYKGVFEHLASVHPELKLEPCGLQVVVHGQVPTGAGVSSSAAIVCSSSLAVLGVLGVKELDKAAVAEFACKAERYVGVTSGGMDQAISMMGRQGVAMHVQFNPVRAQGVELPPGATFVVANSLAVSNKAESAPRRYNMRVVECRLASVLLAMALGMSKDDAVARVRTLRDVEPLIEAKYGKCDGTTAAAAAKEHLKASGYTTPAVEEALGLPLTDLFKGEPGSLRSLQVAAEDGLEFPLQDRAVHVYGEAQRVLDFKATCEDTELAPAERLERLGALMNDSHTSCAQLYGCSCTELDELVDVARGAGALGARLTGAGWGGCTVSLVKEGDVDTFLSALKVKYFDKIIASGRLSEEGLGEVLFATKPSNGAAFLQASAAVV